MIPGLDELQQRMEHIDKYDSKNEKIYSFCLDDDDTRFL